MASRPVFIPDFDSDRLVEERTFEFPWASGFAEVQKKKNIHALHAKARQDGLPNILEISTKSDEKVGQRLSAFSLKYRMGDNLYPLESVYQGSKVFERCGPFPEVLSMSPRDAKKFIREIDGGPLIRFELDGQKFPLSPKNAFYDWLYIRCLVEHADWIEEKVSLGAFSFTAFTDIEFNPAKQVNCQARAFAEFFSLLRKSQLERAAQDFKYFASLLPPI